MCFKYLIPSKRGLIRGGGNLKGALQTELAFQIKGDSVEIFRGSISSVRLRKLMKFNILRLWNFVAYAFDNERCPLIGDRSTGTKWKG